jgi:hypothetical protein
MSAQKHDGAASERRETTSQMEYSTDQLAQRIAFYNAIEMLIAGDVVIGSQLRRFIFRP